VQGLLLLLEEELAVLPFFVSNFGRQGLALSTNGISTGTYPLNSDPRVRT